MQNAFNSINRKTTLNECLTTFPMLFPYFNAMYCDESKLLVRTSNGNYIELVSSEGSRQGDTLGPLFFCIGALILPILKSVIQVLDESKLFVYIDYISIIGPPEELSKAIQIVNPYGPTYGYYKEQQIMISY